MACKPCPDGESFAFSQFPPSSIDASISPVTGANAVSVRILLADDHAIIRRELRRLFEAEEGWFVCGEAENGAEAVALCATLRPDVIALDISMPVMGGIEAARRIREIAPTVAMVIVSMDDNELMLAAAIAAGARGYVVKRDATKHIVPTIRAVLANSSYLRAPSKTP
jgi:DNA-binding NarL/FixJ family response regulator